MGDAEARKSFPDQKQRAAFCYSQYDRKSKSNAKATKEEANYQSMPNGYKRCALCTMFEAPNLCSTVQDLVEPKGYCKYFQSASPTTMEGHELKDFLAISAHSTGTYRVESLGGTQYVVVPVVALVEGVIQGVTAELPELALASEFGRFPASWNGRPLTMDHPHVPGDSEGSIVRVSASASPDIQEQFQIGFIWNTKLVGNKLSMEAWIDPAKANQHSDEARALLAKVKKGEVIEVSTGLFTNLEMGEGVWGKGEKYFSTWRGVVPDHLALLPEGLTGACSVEDGCGAGITAAQAQQGRSASGQAPAFTLRVHKLRDSCSCGGDGNPSPGAQVTPSPPPANLGVAAAAHLSTKKPFGLEDAMALLHNAMPSGMMAMDARQSIQDALDASYPGDYMPYLVDFTNDHAVFSMYNGDSGQRGTFQRKYSIDPTTKEATFHRGEHQAVRLTTTITPRPEAANNFSTQESAMPDPTATATPQATPAATPPAPAPAPAPAAGGLQQQAAPSPPVAPPPEPKKPQTVEEFLTSAPAEIRESLEAGLRMHKERKTSLVAGLKANARNKFTEAQLNAFDIQTLENLTELARVPDYSGQAPAVDALRTQVQPRVNAGDLPYAPPPPRLHQPPNKKGAASDDDEDDTQDGNGKKKAAA